MGEALREWILSNLESLHCGTNDNFVKQSSLRDAEAGFFVLDFQFCC